MAEADYRSPIFDPSAIGDPVKSFFDASKQRAEFDTRRAFRDGVPVDENGQPDFGAIAKTFFQKGDYGQGIAAANLDLQRQQLKFGQQQSAGISNLEGGGQPAQPTISPSANRSVPAPSGPPIRGPQSSMGGAANSPQGDQPGSVVSLLGTAGVPDAQTMMIAGPISKSLGIDPNAPIPPQHVPRVQAAIQAYMQRNGGGQPPQEAPQQGAPITGPVPMPQPRPPGAPQAMPVAGSPQADPAAPIQPTPVQTTSIRPPGAQPGPVTNAVTTPNAPEAPSRVDQTIAYYAGIMSNPMSPKQNVELAKVRLEALQKSRELTNEQKNYAQAVTQGFKGTQEDFVTKAEADKTHATKSAESYIKKYDSIQENGTRAQIDTPQLKLAQTLMDDPNFYSGVGEKYNLVYKRLLSQFGGDPNTAVPQEAFRKIISAGILDQIKAMAGTGPVRVAEMNIIKDAAASQDNSPQSNRLLVELHLRMQKRAEAVAGMAQEYNNGRLDSGFDRKVAEYDRRNPLISDKEIPDFRKIIGGGKEKAAPTATASANPYEAEMRKRGLLK